jgi:prepilin-type N-terminal cleavage/methylation domain-containing protein
VPTRNAGYSLIELLTAIAILAVITLISLPAFGSIRRKAAVRAAAGELRGIVHLARSRAITRGLNAGLRFSQDAGVWQFAVYDDGDGDGIRSEDIARNIDTLLAPPRPVLRETSLATIGVLSRTIIDPDGDRLTPTSSPVQFGRSQICSFSPLGESTPGTVYVTDRSGDIYAVRVFGASAKIRVLRYDPTRRRWVAP